MANTRFKIYYKSNWNSEPTHVEFYNTKAEGIRSLISKHIGSSERDQATKALEERGYYTIGYGPSEVDIEEISC